MTNVELGKQIFNVLKTELDFETWYKECFGECIEDAANLINSGCCDFSKGSICEISKAISKDGNTHTFNIDKENFIEYYGEEACFRMFKTLKDIEEEKCELLGIIQGKDNVIAKFKTQITELEKKNEQQTKQIEEMKCCGNCKIEVKDEEYPCSECDGKSKWELAGSMKLIVYNKSNGLIADEFIYSDEIQITEHVKKFVGDTKNKDCFLLKFPSGNYCFYANSDYYYKITE